MKKLKNIKLNERFRVTCIPDTFTETSNRVTFNKINISRIWKPCLSFSLLLMFVSTFRKALVFSKLNSQNNMADIEKDVGAGVPGTISWNSLDA